jgi:chromosome segregation ATPase
VDLEGEETVSSLREKVRELQRQLRVVSESHSTTTAGADQSSEALHIELEEVRMMKKEREEALIVARKQVAELQFQVSQKQREVEDAGTSAVVKETASKLAASQNTVKLLEEKLKEKEGSINKLEQEKGKLESYAKRSLTAFKEKFMTVLQTMREEKRDLEHRIKIQAEKLEKNQDTWRREERLLSAALFEVGVKIMDRKIHSQLHETLSPQNNTFLGVQREAVGKALVDGKPADTGPESNRRLFSNPSTPQTPATSVK